MATEVNFYHLTRSSLEDTLPRLLTKTMQAGERAVVLLGSVERVDALNTHLWTYDPDGFLPHGAARDGEADRHAGGETDQQADLAKHGHLGKVVEERQSREGFLQHPGTAALGGNLAVDQCIGHELVILAPLRPASA